MKVPSFDLPLEEIRRSLAGLRRPLSIAILRARNPFNVGAIIRVALQAGSMVAIGFSFGLSTVWLALCYLTIVRGWERRFGRIVLALGVSIIFAIVPYFGPMISLSPLVNAECHPNEGGIPPWCRIYGGDVGDPAHEAVRIGWKFFIGAPLAFLTFFFFTTVLLLRKPRPAPRCSEEVSN